MASGEATHRYSSRSSAKVTTPWSCRWILRRRNFPTVTAGTRTGADRAVSASNFMYMALQEWAVERGFRVFDFCRSRADSGAFQFKKHQGFEPVPLHYRYALVRDKDTPSFTPSNPKTRVLRSAWSHLPLWLARRLSATLARFIQ